MCLHSPLRGRAMILLIESGAVPDHLLPRSFVDTTIVYDRTDSHRSPVLTVTTSVFVAQGRLNRTVVRSSTPRTLSVVESRIETIHGGRLYRRHLEKQSKSTRQHQHGKAGD